MEINIKSNKEKKRIYCFKNLLPGDVFVQEGGEDYAVLIKISDKQAISLCSDEDDVMFVDFDEDERIYSVTNLEISYSIEME